MGFPARYIKILIILCNTCKLKKIKITDYLNQLAFGTDVSKVLEVDIVLISGILGGGDGGNLFAIGSSVIEKSKHITQNLHNHDN